jgi:hypothetical protein
MYTIVRKEGKVLVLDADSKPVYVSPEDAYLIHHGDVLGTEQIVVSRVKDLKDDQLLLALAKVVKLA